MATDYRKIATKCLNLARILKKKNSFAHPKNNVDGQLKSRIVLNFFYNSMDTPVDYEIYKCTTQILFTYRICMIRHNKHH